MTRIIIPQLDANLVDVTITHWRKQVGDPVAAGESVAELTTDKAAYELEAPAAGTLLFIYAAEKSVVPTGFAVGLIGAPGESDPEAEAANAARLAAFRGTPATPSAVPSAGAKERAARVRATPRARRLAQEKGLDLAKIQAETGAELIDEKVLAPFLK